MGGLIGAKLQQAGEDVRFVQRPGKHLETLQSSGMTLITPEGQEKVSVRAFESPLAAAIEAAKDVVLLCVKSQNTVECLEALRTAAGAEVPVVFVQNGVANEPTAIRMFKNVYGMNTIILAQYQNPGEIVSFIPKGFGCLDTGRYPNGVDLTATELCKALTKAGFVAQPDPEVMKLKYSKLMGNLANALNACVGSMSGEGMKKAGPMMKVLRAEAEACFKAAGIQRDEKLYAERQKVGFKIGKVAGHPSFETSSYQSVERGADRDRLY